MKKISLFLFVFTLFITYSCSNTTTEEVVEEETIEVEAVEEETAEAEVVEEVSSMGLPTFENEELNTFISEYDALVSKMIEMLKAGDFEGVATLEAEGTALAEKAESYLSTVSPEDAEKISAYIASKEAEVKEVMGF